MCDRNRLLASVTAVQADRQGHVASVSGALVLAHAAVAQGGEVHSAEGVTELAQVFDLAHLDIGVGLVLGEGAGTGLAANGEAAAGGCVEVVVGHEGSSKGTLDKSRSAAGG
ncbi:hypothetical protein D3C78_1446460 [compost metagenome]